jgi:hypothetical protein
MKLKLRKIDAIIVVILIIIASIVIFRVGYIEEPKNPNIPDIVFYKDNLNRKLIVESASGEVFWSEIEISGICDTSTLGKYVTKGDEITKCYGTITITHKPTGEFLSTWKFPPAPQLPTTYTTGPERAVTPEDEGFHYDKILVGREWWTYTAVLSDECDLPGYTVTISFNRMALGDIFGTLKPDLMVVTINGPEGKSYGGIINKPRGIGGLGILKKGTLQASSPGVDVTFGNSYAQGFSPSWYVHVEDEDIDSKNEIVIDLDYFAPSPALWIHSNRILDKGDANKACYMFFGCNVSGTISINNLEYKVNGIGHHEHAWSPNKIVIGKLKGWDFHHIVFDNGYNLYFTNYLYTRQLLSTKISTINPFANCVISTDQGETLTKLNDITITTVKSEKLFLFLKIPTEITIVAKPSITQPLLRPYNIKLELTIKADNTFDKTWKLPSFVGMKTGRSIANGIISWSDDTGEHQIELNGIGSVWDMRR